MSYGYLKFVLTVIALELLWLAVNGVPGTAFAQADSTPVVITGIRFDTPPESTLPVGVSGPITIVPIGPVKVEADRPLPVESVPYTPSARPGD
jgi:hypothetical protein